MRWLASSLIILLVMLQAQLWFGDFGVFKLWRLEQSVAEQARENAELVERNQRLHAKVVELKRGEEALEERARSQLGLIKEGEVFYRLIPREQGDRQTN